MTNSELNQSNYHFQYSIYVDNSKEKVWDYLTDVSRWNEWDTELLDSKLSGNLSVGAKGMLIPKKGPKLKFHISKCVPYVSYTFVTRMPVGTLEIKRSIEEGGNHIKFTDEIKFTGVLKRFFGFMLGSGFKSVLPEVMQRFKELVEKE